MSNFTRRLILKIHKSAYYSSLFSFVFFSFFPFILIYAMTYKEVAFSEYTLIFQTIFSTIIVSFLISGILNPVFSAYVGRARYYESYNGVFIWLCIFLVLNFALLLLLIPAILHIPFFSARKPFFFLSGLTSFLALATGYLQVRDKFLLIIKSGLYSLFCLFLYLVLFRHAIMTIIHGYELFLSTVVGLLIFYAWRIDKKVHKYLTDFLKILKDCVRFDKITISLLLVLLWLPEKLIIFNSTGVNDFRELMIKYTLAFFFVFPAYCYIAIRVQAYFSPFRAKTPFFKQLSLAPYGEFLKEYENTLSYIKKTFAVSFVYFFICLSLLFTLTVLSGAIEYDILLFAAGTFFLSVFLFMISLLHSFQFDTFAVFTLFGYYILNIVMAFFFIRQADILSIVAGNAVISAFGMAIAMFYFKKLNLSNVNNYLRRFSSVYPALGILQESYPAVEEQLNMDEVRRYAANYIKRHRKR